MFWPKHIRELIVSFRPPWWIDVDIADLLEKEAIDDGCFDYHEYLDNKFPDENWEHGFYMPSDDESDWGEGVWD